MVERKRTANFCLLLILHYHEAGSTIHNKTDRQTDRQKENKNAKVPPFLPHAKPYRQMRFQKQKRESPAGSGECKKEHTAIHTYMWVILAPCLALLRQTTSRNPARHRPRCSTPALRPLRLATRRREREREARRKTNSRVPIPAYPSNTQNPSSISRPKGNDWTSLDKSKLIQVPLWDPETTKRSRVQTQWCAGETRSLRALCLRP
jgi:hypothetical protein